MTSFWDPDPRTAEALRTHTGAPGPAFATQEELADHLALALDEDTVVVGPTMDLAEALKFSEAMRLQRPSLGVVLVRTDIDADLLTEALRAGVREVVNDRDPRDLQMAIMRSAALSAQLREQPGALAQPARPQVRGRVITVFSAKGGCGKTTLATNLAAALADRGRRQVCIVDLDLAFGDVAIALQLFPAHTIADAVPLSEGLDYTGVHALLTQHSPGLSALVAPLEPGSAESIPATLVSHVLDILREHFDYIVVDTPPAFDDQVLAAFDVSDIVALIATLDVPALKNLKLTLETLELLNYPREKWRIVLNRADSKVGLGASEVEKTLRSTIALQIPSSRDVPAAINRGVPIVLDDPKHAVSVAIRSFADRQVVVPADGAARGIPEELRQDRRGRLRKRGRRSQ